MKRLILTLILLMAGTAGAEPNLVAHWKFDDAVDTNVVLDSSGNGYNGTSIRNTSLMHTTGKIGGALTFDGTSDYIDTGNIFRSTFRDSFSISLWCRPNNGIPILGQTMIGYSDTASRCRIVQGFVFSSPGQFLFDYEVDGENNVAFFSSVVFVDGPETWHHIVATLTEDSATQMTGRIYFDGVLVGTKTNNSAVMNNYIGNFPVYIGAEDADDNYSKPFSGSLDDVRIYNKALTQGEITALYQGTLSCFWCKKN
jgi:hypothetical protein